MILIIILAVVSFIIYFAWGAFPGISGYGAKNLCSCVFLANRNEDSVKKEELSDGFLKFGKFTVNRQDSSVTGTVMGMAIRKAIYRNGVGCTLINDITEEELRQKKILIPAHDNSKINSAFLESNPDSLSKDSVDIQALNHTVASMFSDSGIYKNTRTRAVVIIQDGKLISEKYAPGFDADSKMLGWSMAKSMTSAMIGILVKEGKLKMDQPAPVDEWSDPKDSRHEIKLEHLLQQTSGLDFVEKYGRPSEVITMLFSKGNMAAYAAGRKSKSKPGIVFNYTSGNTNILQGIIRKTVGESGYHAFPYNALFHKIGMKSAVLETDAAGNFVGSSYIYATARDYAKFGLLYLNDGVWKNERILPEGWVKQTCIPAQAEEQKQYGFQFWLNGIDKKDKSKRVYDGVPADMFYADGYGGQRIFIIPSKKLVIVRMGLRLFDDKTFLRQVVSCIK